MVSINQKRTSEEEFGAIDRDNIHYRGPKDGEVAHLEVYTLLYRVALCIFSQRIAGFPWMRADETLSLGPIWLMHWDGLLR